MVLHSTARLQEQAVTELWCIGGDIHLSPPAALGWKRHSPEPDEAKIESPLSQVTAGIDDSGAEYPLLKPDVPSHVISSPSLSSICRWVPTSGGPEEALMSLLRHDAVEAARRYAVAEHTCGICFCDVLGRDMRMTSPGTCTHRFCKECLEEQARIHVGEGNLTALTCPEPSCSAAITPSVLSSLLSDEQYERWERLTLERSLDSMSDLVYCPRCETAVIEDEGGDHCGQCTSCMFVFCSICREAWHPGSACLTPERRLEVLQVRGVHAANFMYCCPTFNKYLPACCMNF